MLLRQSSLNPTSAPLVASRTSRLVPAVAAAVIGLVVLYASAFVEAPAVHDAAHDGRHSAGFPCH